MEARMKNPAYVLPDTMTGIQTIFKGIYQGGVSQELLELVALRTSQINGCSACVLNHAKSLRKAGVPEEKVDTVAAWQEAPYFTEAEQAALTLAEAVTRLADRSGQAVSDKVWDEVADHFDEKQLSAILLNIAMTNLFNRLNATLQEPAGQTWG